MLTLQCIDDGEEEERNCIEDEEVANGDDNHCLKWALNQNPAMIHPTQFWELPSSG